MFGMTPVKALDKTIVYASKPCLNLFQISLESMCKCTHLKAQGIELPIKKQNFKLPNSWF